MRLGRFYLTSGRPFLLSDHHERGYRRCKRIVPRVYWLGELHDLSTVNLMTVFSQHLFTKAELHEVGEAIDG